MKTVSITAAKIRLSDLVEKAAAGGEVIITKAGKPVARLVALEKPNFRKSARPRLMTTISCRLR